MEDTAPVIRTVRFDAEDVRYIESGTDFREGTRLYTSGVVGTLHLCINGEELIVERRFPEQYEISDTVRAMFEMIRGFRTSDHERTAPFCCVCGSRGCAYVRWELKKEGRETTLQMEELSDAPIGQHRYRIRIGTIREAVSDLAGTVIATLDDIGVNGTTAGTIHEFRRWQNELDE